MSAQLPTSESWDAYWHGAKHGAAFSAGGTSHPLVLSFWDAFFTEVKDDYPSPRIVDIASGSGAVIERAKAAFDGQLADFSCLDISSSAITMLTEKYPEVHGLIADARSIPLTSADYDVATSQFGIEYAGLDAIDEVARLLAPGGRLGLLLHHRAGGIYKQCAASLDAIKVMQEVKFIDLCIATLEAGFAAGRGEDKDAYARAAKRLVPAIRTVEAIMKQHGTEVADGTIVRLYKDVREVLGRMAHYEPAEVLGWLQRMRDEIQAFGGRMASMCDSALSESRFEQLCTDLQQQGFEILRKQALREADRGLPLAWSLVAAKK